MASRLPSINSKSEEDRERAGANGVALPCIDVILGMCTNRVIYAAIS
jgi:hypothetical protein